MTGREPAWRITAHELNSAVHDERGTGERAASYLISPYGTRMNRALIVGSLAPPETVGGDPAQPFLRSRLTDATGACTVTAGSYQPRALAAFRRVERAGPVLVVGKAHVYRGRNDVAYPSLRAEAIRALSETEYRAHFLETLRQSAERLALVEAIAGGARASSDPETPARWWVGATAARHRYPSASPAEFRGVLAGALRSLSAEGPLSADAVPVPPSGGVGGGARVIAVPVPGGRPPPSAAARAEESAFLDIVDDLADRSADGYADLREALGAAGRRGVTAAVAEELLNRLEETGVLEEPIVGKIRRA